MGIMRNEPEPEHIISGKKSFVSEQDEKTAPNNNIDDKGAINFDILNDEMEVIEFNKGGIR